MKPVPVLGALEDAVMAIVWRAEAATTKDVLAQLDRVRAYNTIQTTLDRLVTKGLLRRDKHSHAYVYSPTVTRDAYHRGRITALVAELLPAESKSVLAAFVDLAEAADVDNLDRLDRLIAAKRALNKPRG